MKYMVDIDNTIIDSTGGDYKNAKPMVDRIAKMNKLFDEGHEITYWTARGSTSGIDWVKFTVEQLDKFGVKYTRIKFEKPHYDVWIDDKAVCDTDFFK